MLLGTNLNIKKGFTVDEIKSIGAAVIRFPIWTADGFDYSSFIAECYKNDIECIAVLDQQALGELPGRSTKVKIRNLFKMCPNLKWLQISNEPDGTGDSSSQMTQSKYISLLRAVNKEIPPTVIRILAGMCFSKPKWFSTFMNKYGEEVKDTVDYIAVHHYGLYPSEDFQYPETGFGCVTTNLDAVIKYGIPLIVSEYGGSREMYDSDAQAAEWLSRTTVVYYEYGINMAIQFCYSDQDLDKFGMILYNGEWTEVAAAFKGAADWINK